ncbi:transcriptional regulator, TetR family [Gleimia coleocanis DSM 15436]|uniref:Transcriptional regulator, TetR family n=1 Tax=Gleimia coleocanis DSM 15436 TaxID=525245 RepID=C0W194_9ACTO|nr:TetR/AcrR family transcriptional regulator [Gleimia coleocanis]EEH63583.1 transcriptional regulator, TetR family [Gleimia coleocanis DSM 15436]
MVKLSRPPRKEVKAGILETAAHEFLSFGYHDARIARIAAKAGYTKGALYSNFGSKPQLFTEVLMEHLKVTEVTFVPEMIRILQTKQPAEATAQQLSNLLQERSVELLPWQVLIAQFRLLAVNDSEARDAYQAFMEFYLNLALEICDTNELLTHVTPTRRRIIVFSALQIINSATLEAATLTSLTAEYFSNSLAAIFMRSLKDLKNENAN